MPSVIKTLALALLASSAAAASSPSTPRHATILDAALQPELAARRFEPEVLSRDGDDDDDNDDGTTSTMGSGASMTSGMPAATSSAAAPAPATGELGKGWLAMGAVAAAVALGMSDRSGKHERDRRL
jgi:hypothetical protein